MARIRIWDRKTSKTDLMTYNGDYILDNICIKSEVTEEINGEFGLDNIFIIDNKYSEEIYNMISEDSILTVEDEFGEEHFRIAQVRKNRRDIETYSRHITISDILTMWCEDVRPTGLNGNAAINWIFDKAIGSKWFNVSSNIANVGTAYYQNKNVYQALFDSENSFLDRWGGEVERRGFNIVINDRIGSDKGVTIRSRKNLTGFEASSNINKLATRIYPKGYDGITIEEKYIDSPIINNYSKVFTIEYKFDDIRVNDEDFDEGFATLKLAQDEMKKRVKKLYEVDKVDIINSEYRINFVELAKTEEYKNYSILETTFLGDTVQVIEERLNMNIMVRVQKRIYDTLRKERISTELSNKDLKVKPPTLNDIIKEIENMPSQDDTLQKAKDNASAIINAGMKNSNVIVRKNEILIMDTKDINTAKKVWRWNVGGLGYSSTGYYGEYGTAITNDGQIVANFITTGVLNANVIRAGVIQGFNGNLIINLDTGYVKFNKGLIEGENCNWNLNTGEFNFLDEGKKALEIERSNIRFFDWGKTTEQIGQISAFNNLTTRDTPSISINNRLNSYIGMTYMQSQNPTVNYNYMVLDKHNITKNDRKSPIIVYEEASFNKINAFEINWGKGHDAKIVQLVDGSLNIQSDLWVDGTIHGNTALNARIEALENIELQKEGLI